MVEETNTNTNNTAVTSNGQTTNTEQKPAWQAKADELKNRIDGTLFVQLAYRSDNNHKCEPVLLSEKQVGNIFPIVVDAPTGLTDPVFDYSRNVWIENSTAGQARQIANLTQEVAKIKNDQEEATEAKAQDDKKADQALKLMTMISAQMGVLNAKVEKLTQPATTTPDAKPAQPTTEGGNK